MSLPSRLDHFRTGLGKLLLLVLGCLWRHHPRKSLVAWVCVFPRFCVRCGVIKECGHGFCGFCCCGDTVTLFYEPVLFIGDDGWNMASSIVGATKRREKFQMALMECGNETKVIKLEQNNGWDFNRGLKRGHLEIKAEILGFCSQQKTKTNIMYNVNLNYAQLKKQLKSLTSNGLLTTNKNMYATTQKGYHFLELFFQLNDILDS